MNYITNNYVTNIINRASSAILDHFVVELPGYELYAMLCSDDDDMLEIFARAASYMKPANYHEVLEIPVLMRDQSQPVNMTFTFMMENSNRYHRYLTPRRMPVITPESKLYDKLETAITLAQEWQITKAIYHRFSDLNTDQVVYLLPWLKEIGADAVMGLENADSPAQFLSNHGCGRVSPKLIAAVKAQFARMASPGRANHTPALTSRINKACRFGDKLFGQWRMMKHKEARMPVGSYVTVAMTDTILPEWYKADIEAVMEQWKEDESIRQADRAMTRTFSKLMKA